VVRARKPQNFHALKAGASGEDVLEGVVEDMAQGEDAGDVGGRDDDGKSGFGGSGVGPVVASFRPLAIKAILHLGGVVGWSELGHGAVSLPSGEAIEKPAKKN
jgi:hypothetical protein